MAEEHSGDQLFAKEARKMTVLEAVHLVNAEIEAVRKRLEDIVQTIDASPIMVEGRTSTNCDAQVMADPSKIAKIMLKHEYHLWSTLEQEVSEDMWRDIAEMVGLERAYSVDISLKPKQQYEEPQPEHKN